MATNDTKCITSARIASQWDISNAPPEMQNIPQRLEYNDHPSAFSTWGTRAGASELNASVAKVIHSIISGIGGEVAIVKIGDNQYAAERRNPVTGETTVVSCNSKGLIRGAVVKESGRYVSIPTLPDEKADVTPIYAVYLALLVNTDLVGDLDVSQPAKEALEALTILDNPYDDDGTELIHLLNDTLISGFDKSRFPCKLSNGNITLLTEENIRLSFSNGQIICGSPAIIAANAVRNSMTTLTAGQARKMFEPYALRQKWDAEAEKLIPRFDDDFPVMPEVIRIARYFVESRGKRRPMNNFLWRGVTSYGNSTGVELIAHILHTPLVRVTCSSNMEAQEFLSQFVPDGGAAGTDRCLPSFEDIMYDPESAYETIVGYYQKGITCQQALEAYGKACGENRGNGGGNARFKLVESNYVKALRNGWICEIQELSRIRDAGTMVTLNEYDRAGAIIPLVDGSWTRRAENAMVIYTDNVGYTSCRQIDPSVMRRMDLVLSSYELTDEAVRGRIVYNTGCADDDRLERMMNVWKSVISYCRENEINEGEISVNELERWVSCVMIEKDSYREACRECVISKASSDRDTQEEIWTQAALPLIEMAA